MRKFIKISGLVIAVVLLTIACDTNPSLQKYYVDSKENSEFISIDLPSSILQLKDTDVSNDIKNTLETIKKVNFLALQLNETNGKLYTSEKAKVKSILKNPKYKQLMRMNMGDGNVSVNYLGEEDAIDEVVIFGSDNDKGFAIVRVIGENMNPSDILKLTQEIKMDDDSPQLKQLESLLSSIK
ncbi:MAG: DUF4252 domain-containing protein [Lutibacter sp.]|uniref:DUF4252 domain-containing protein n=1 Tax=Lutibacter sp. TaxID=1925666 RepID=UPI001836664A|nr:DUF4252 domain-containing protein [Lutibacter sp.]MBT8317861.1 DUF4252 domain-containing protein [Lutibacter sp.]NNJ58719.1 DUF4252 domain-containing protein [Lutibacter sp.]